MGDFLYLRIMNYQLIHDSIIDRAKTRVLPKEVYTERHHIKPRCMGGSDDKSNLVDLTAKEHFIVHKLLVEIYPTSNELVNAIWCMSNLNNSMGRNYRVGAMEYERLKVKWSIILSETMSGENNPMSGRNPYEVWVDKYGKEEADRLQKEKNERQSKTMKEKGIAPEHMAKIIHSNKNRVVTEETRKKLSDSNKGENNAMFGKTGELNPRYGISTYDTWLEKYGKDKADKLMSEYSNKMSQHNKGEGNPMFGKSVYDVWLEKYGKDEADKRNDEANQKRRDKLKGNKNQKTRKVVCTLTGEVHNSVTEVANKIGMKVGTLYNKLSGVNKNNTTYKFL